MLELSGPAGSTSFGRFMVVADLAERAKQAAKVLGSMISWIGSI